MAESGRQVEDAAKKSTESLTQLLARILNQLSVSAWLPAAAAVFAALMFANLRSHNADPVQALAAISSMGWGSLVLATGAVVLVTVLTQAFGFETIRLLEGYWGGGRFGGGIAKLCCSWQQRRHTRLEERLRKLLQVAFEGSTKVLERDDELRPLLPIVRAALNGEPLDSFQPDKIVIARQIDWTSSAWPGDWRRVEALSNRLESEYPDDSHRLLPTRLGNVLRATEDRIHDAKDGSLEGWVERVFHRLPDTMQREHDQVRSRLDLYCTMVFVFTSSAAGAFLALGWSWPAAISAGICLGLALVSYRAAVASARWYGSVLESIADFLTSHPDDGSSGR